MVTVTQADSRLTLTKLLGQIPCDLVSPCWSSGFDYGRTNFSGDHTQSRSAGFRFLWFSVRVFRDVDTQVLQINPE